VSRPDPERCWLRASWPPGAPGRFQELSAACLPVPAAGQLCLERGMTWRIAIGTCGVTGTNFCSGDVEETGWLG